MPLFVWWSPRTPINGFFSAWWSFKLHLRMLRWAVLTDNDSWKCFWAQAVISRTESGLFLMQSWTPRASHTDIRLCPLHRDVFRLSESFTDIMFCRWWDIQHLQSFTLRNILKLLNNLSVQFFADCRTSAHLYFWETLPLQGALFIPSHLSDLLSINRISRNMSVQLLQMCCCHQIQDKLIFLIRIITSDLFYMLRCAVKHWFMRLFMNILHIVLTIWQQGL